MKTIIAILIVAILAGGGFWIWKANQDKETTGTDVVTSISAFNQTKNADASTVAASARDVIVYTLTIEDKTDKVAAGYVTEVSIADISDAATLVDASGANYNSATNSLVWTPLDVPANGSLTKKFTVKVKDTQAANSDYVMTAKFNNEVAVNIAKAAVAQTPAPTPTPASTKPTPAPVATPYKAPTTGPTGMIVFFIALGITVGAGLVKLGRRISARS